MKIAIWHNLPSGGGKRALFDQVSGLIRRGHVVEVWCPPTAAREYLPLASLGIPEHVTPLSEVPLAPGLSNLLWQAAGSVSTTALHVSRSAKAMDEHSIRVAAEIEAGNFDVLLAHPCQSYAAPAIGRYVKIPSALYLQEPFRLLYEAMPTLAWLSDAVAGSGRERASLPNRIRHRNRVRNLRAIGQQELRNARGYDLLLVNSLFSRESLLRAYGLDSRVCLLGVDTDRFTDLGLPRERMVIGLGTIQPHKNVKLIVQAVSTIPPPQPKLIWIGNYAKPDYLQEVSELAKSAGVDFEAKVLISDVEIQQLLNRASVMAYAPRLEPFGYAPLEANACGTPVVAVAEGGVRETVENGRNGVLVEHDAGAIANALSSLLDNPGEARRLGAAARTWVTERFSLAAATDRLENYLLSLIAGRKSESV